MRNPEKYISEKYKEFYDKKGYVPKMFNPYNCAEIKDISPTLLTNCGGLTVSSTVLIIEDKKTTFKGRFFVIKEFLF